MSQCTFSLNPSGLWECGNCHSVCPIRCDTPPAANCAGSPDLTQAAIKGPGDFLHDAILKWVAEGPKRECGCVDHIVAMNAWGPSGCRVHLDEIVGWLMDEATKRGWWKYAVALPGSRMFIKRMVLGAIKKSEQAAAIAIM